MEHAGQETPSKELTDTNGRSETSSLDNEYFLPISKTKRLPNWLDHFNLRDLKILFKCSAAAWILTLLIVIDPTLKAIGQATFFGIIVIFIVPPSGVAFIGLMAGITVVLGVCLGWAWGVITMKAALATRPAADLQQQYAAVQAAASGNTTNNLQASGQTTYQQIAIYDGYLLDTRVTLTYFCMMGLFIYLMARIRVAAPKLTLVQMFAIIVSDIFLTIGPLLPTFSGTIPQTLAIPAITAVGINLVCNFLFFPQSTSHIVMFDMEKMLGSMDSFLEACTIYLANPKMKMDIQRLKRTKIETIQLYRAFGDNLKFLALDVSVCRWSAGDIKSLNDPLLQVVVSFASLVQIEVTRLEFILKDQTLLEMAEKIHTKEGKESLSGGHQFARAFDLRQQYRSAEGDQAREAIMKDFGTEATTLLHSSQQALLMVREAIRECNNRRWIRRLSPADGQNLRTRHAEVLSALKIDMEQFPAKVAQKLLDHNNKMRQQNGGESDQNQATGSVYVLVMEERLLGFADSVHKILTRVLELEEQRQKDRFWWPASIKDIVPLALDRDSNDANLEPTMSRVETARETPSQSDRHAKSKKEEVSSIDIARTTVLRTRGRKQRALPGRIALAVAHWFGNTEGLFALRVLIVSLGLSALAANRNTAGFFYREKGLWALIMAQTAMTPYTGDYIYGLFVRLLGTVIGAVLGLAAWYIGAGPGSGSAYGIAAIMLPIIVVAMWLRLFASPAMLQGIIISVATLYLVVSFSWVDAHIPSYGNPGVGVSVFWRRLLLVLIGFGASTLVTLFPRPPSANRHCRRILTSSLQTNKDQYALFASTKAHHHKPDDVRRVSEKTAIALAEPLHAIEPLIKLTRLELSTSPIDSATLSLLCHLILNVNQYITQLTLHTAYLTPEMKAHFFTTSGAASENTIADIMAIVTVIQHALIDGRALPAVLPSPLMERRLTSMKAQWNGADLNLATLSTEVLADRALRHYLSALAAFVQLLGSVDEMVLVVKRAVGETSYVDLEA